MRRRIGKLSPAHVRRASRPGIYGDGGGLWLHVGPSGNKSWLFNYMLHGAKHEMGLGPTHTVSLAEAREKARACRKQKLEGIDPLAAKHAARAAQRLAAAATVTFQESAERYIAAHRAGWKNAKHAAQWSATLETYAYPVLGALPVGAIDTGHVTRVLEPMWTKTPETASRVRGRIEAVLDYAAAHGWRTGENPARWRGHLENILPRRSKVRAIVHHAALAWREAPAFMAALADQHDVPALALRFAILTAARAGEVFGARWSEVDTVHFTWTVPAERMKAGKEHRVPLSDAAMAVLREAALLRTAEDGFVFPGIRAGKPLYGQAMRLVLARMGRTDVTVHGFRSVFREWAAETGKTADIAEAALAHAVGGRVVAAYQRGDLMERRRVLMDQWATFITGSGEIVPLRRVVR